MAVVAVLTLALGIGANSAIFSAVQGVLLRDLPFPQADRLTMLWLDNSRLGIRTDITSYPNFQDTRDHQNSYEKLAGFRPRRLNITGEGGPERLRASAVTTDFFDVMGVRPSMGRIFSPEEESEGTAPMVILSHNLWQRRFGGDPLVLGRNIQLNDESHQVIGIMPEGFSFPDENQIWLPMRISERLRSARGAFWLYQVGRLKPSVSPSQAQAEMDTAAARLSQDHSFMAGYGLFVQPMREHLVGQVRPALLVLLGAVALVLIIACANVAHLLLARALARRREVSIRLALGAGRLRLIRQMVVEAVVLALAGGLLGTLVAVLGVRLLTAFGPEELVRLGPIGLDTGVLAFTLSLSLLTGLLVGLVPAFQATRFQVVSGLKDGRAGTGGRRSRKLRSSLAIGEVALALVLLVGAGLLLTSLDKLLKVDSGLRTQGVLTVDLPLVGGRYSENAAVIQFYDQLLARLREHPGVQAAAAGSSVLIPQLANSGNVSIEGVPDRPSQERVEVTIDAVTPGYFDALGIPLLQGRDFASADNADVEQVAIINQAMARRHWPQAEAIGKRFKFGEQENDQPWFTIVGVVGDARRTALEKAARPASYVPHAQAPFNVMTLVVESSGDPKALVRPIRQMVSEFDANLPVGAISTLEEQVGERTAPRRFQTLMLGLFSALALLLAMIGIYGVMAHSVSESTRDLGVRMALGASRRDVLGFVLRQGFGLVVLGLVIGLPAAAVLTRGLRSLLYDTSILDPVTFVAVPAVLIAVALVACYFPARRATRVSPIEVLRNE